MTVPFLLLATQRTGSSWVQEMLDSHPGVKVYSELFIAGSRGRPLWGPGDIDFIETYWEQRVRPPSALTRQYWTMRYLQRVFGQPDCAAVGFKYMYDQIRRSPPVLPYAAARRVRVVHLVRRNLLDVVVSSRRALHTGVFHLAGDGRPPIPWAPAELDRSRFSLDPGQVVRELRRLTRERALVRGWLRLTRTPSIEVRYEDLLGDQARFGEILDFLGVARADPSRLRSGLQKIRSEPLQSVVENLGELRAALAGTSFERFLTAGPAG